MAVGAEALREGIEIEVAENEWSKAEWYAPVLYSA